MTVVSEADRWPTGAPCWACPADCAGSPSTNPTRTTRRLDSSTCCPRPGRGPAGPRDRRWRHTHEFATSDSGTTVSDRVDTPVPAAALRPTFVYRNASSSMTSPHTATPPTGRRTPRRRDDRRVRPGRLGALRVPDHGWSPRDRLVRTAAHGADERRWDPQAPAADLLRGVDAVVHLAGASIAGRFTDGHKAAIRDSRIEPTRLLAEAAATPTADRDVRQRVGDRLLRIRPRRRAADRGQHPRRRIPRRRGRRLGGRNRTGRRRRACAWCRCAPGSCRPRRAAPCGCCARCSRRARRSGGRRQSVAVVDRPGRPGRRLLPGAVRRSADRTRQRRRSRTGTQHRVHPRSWRGCCTARRCCRCRRSVRGCCSATGRPRTRRGRPAGGADQAADGGSPVPAPRRRGRAGTSARDTADGRPASEEAAHQSRIRDGLPSASSVVRTKFVVTEADGHDLVRRGRRPARAPAGPRRARGGTAGRACGRARMPVTRWRSGRSRWLPGGSVHRSKCHWNHGPAGTRSGRSLVTSYQPISGVEIARPTRRTPGRAVGRRSTRRAARRRFRGVAQQSASPSPTQVRRSASSYTGHRAPSGTMTS